MSVYKEVCSGSMSISIDTLNEQKHTVANNDGVDKQGQESALVLGGVVLEQSSGVIVADGSVRGTLSADRGGCGSQSDVAETHGE